jgi:signal transduction histidine kinase
MPPQDPPPPEARRHRVPWQPIYYGLAAFNVLTVVLSLYLNYRVTDLYVQAVASNADSAQLLADFTAVEQLAAAVNASGNDVFATRDPLAESRRKHAAVLTLAERLAALRKDLAASAPTTEAPALLAGLDAIEAGVGTMSAEADQVLERFAGDRDLAAQHMAAMDREYARVLEDLRDLRLRFGHARSPRPIRTPEPEPAAVGMKEPRWQRFERQTARVAFMQRGEFLIAGAIVLMVVGAVLYGRSLSRQMDQDATERARYVAELSEARATLEKRVEERTQALERAQAARGREERMAAMGALVAGVAHEVRNPLFGISGTVEAFERRVGSDTYAKYFDVLKQDVARLRALMRDLLDYGKPAQLEKTSVRVDSLLEEAVKACEPLARDLQGLRLEKDVPDGLPPVFVDRSRMVQVFQNLIQNALQHSPESKSVLVEAGRAGEIVWASVRDAGPGFPAEDLQHLFEPFFTRREGGTGLGLSIAQRIVELHGGTITAENHTAGGAVVTVRLPALAEGGE